MNNLLLRYLAYLGPNKETASIELEQGLNVICGASETGKSFLVESIDFMLGGQEPPRDIPEGAGYDRVRLLIESEGQPPLNLERSIEGGEFSVHEEDLRGNTPKTAAYILRAQHSQARQDTLSHTLLKRVGLTDKRIRKNSAGKTRTLSIRDLIRLSVVTEEEIQRRGSPLLSGQFTQTTSEYAVFKLLLTGTDDSALISTGEAPGKKTSVSGKIELLNEMIEELQHSIQEEGLVEDALKDQFAKLTHSIDKQNSALKQVQSVLDELLEKRIFVTGDVKKLMARRLEIKELIDRFNLLDQQYETDLKRLEAIKESGSLFVHLERKECPLCGAAPGSQHINTDCDGNTEEIVLAAATEIKKTIRLQRELEATVDSLEKEDKILSVELLERKSEYADIDKQLSEMAKPAVLAERTSYNELVLKRAEVNNSLNRFAHLQRLVRQKEQFEESLFSTDATAETRTSIPKTTLDQFSQTIERILVDWHFPNASRVFFDETKKDFQIAGKERGSTGKGLRAITHAAFNIGLLEFCLEHDLPHPRFVVLDSPLLAYWKPEGHDDDLRGTDLKDRFYEYLLGLRSDAQVLVIENEHPPEFVEDRGNVIIFTKNPHQDRYGFFLPT